MKPKALHLLGSNVFMHVPSRVTFTSHSEHRCRWIRRRFWLQVASDVRERTQKPMNEQKAYLENRKKQENKANIFKRLLRSHPERNGRVGEFQVRQMWL